MLRCMTPLTATAMLVVGVMALTACPNAGTPVSPEQVTAAHVESSRAGDQQRAARWLSKGAQQRGLPWPAPSEVPTGTVAEMKRHATWVLPSGRRILIHRGGAGWRIDAGVLGLDRATTPQQALSVLARVIRSRDYAGLLELLPGAERKRWTPERLAQELDLPARRKAWKALADVLAEASTPWPLAWLAPGQRARLTIRHKGLAGGAPTVIVLVKEGDGWKVLDVAPRSLYTSRR